MYSLLSLSVITIVFFSSNNLSAQANSSKMGVVEVESVLKELPEAIQADKVIKEKGQKWQDTLLKMQQDLQAKLEVYQKQKSMMPQDKQQKEEETLQAQNTLLLQYREEKFGQQGEINKLREDLLEPIRSKIRKAIESVAKEEKILLVVDKMAAIYADQSIDITFKVIDRIKRGTN
jgi:outer membrane protein